MLPDADDRGDLAGCPRRGCAPYLRYYQEEPSLPGMEARRHTVDGMSIARPRPAEKASALGKGIIFALPHMGNWDLAGAVHHRARLPRSPRSPSGSSPDRCTAVPRIPRSRSAWKSCR
ncbi:hypothetical protein ACU686_04870 [Yinghuangia aomiensis]